MTDKYKNQVPDNSILTTIIIFFQLSMLFCTVLQVQIREIIDMECVLPSFLSQNFVSTNLHQVGAFVFVPTFAA
jgi:hypothetical protein